MGFRGAIAGEGPANLEEVPELQSSHSWKAAVEAPPHHHVKPAEHGIADWAALLAAIALMVGVPAFVGFVCYRSFRWFVRATR